MGIDVGGETINSRGGAAIDRGHLPRLLAREWSILFDCRTYFAAQVPLCGMSRHPLGGCKNELL
jgi:hypothetical protein